MNSNNTRAKANAFSSASGDLNVVDTNGNSIDFAKVIIELTNGSSSDREDFITINTIEELRNYEPNSSGEIAVVLEYYSGSRSGGGIFFYDYEDKTSADDQGVIIVTPSGARWKRYLTNHADLTIAEFGAIADGQTDCLDAVTRMWNWSQQTDSTTGNQPFRNIGIRFPAGKFFISKFDISENEVDRFRLVGPHINFGYYPSTTLISDQQDGEVMFTVKARRVSIAGLYVDGQDNTKNKGFFKNICPGGQFVRVTGMNFENMGGRALDMLDTLDCKIDQWYASNCAATVVYATWSNQEWGSWDHITAIELSNFNIQSGSKEEMLDLQRAGQSLIRNGWIEHTEYPGNLSNGQWIFDALNLETNTNPLKCHHTRIVSTQLNIQVGEGLDLSDEGERWLSIYEMGRLWLENHGIQIDGSLSYDYLSSPDRMDNRRDQETWFHLADAEVPEWSTLLQVKIFGTTQYLLMSGTQTNYDVSTPEGEATINIQNVNGTFSASWSGEGAVPVVRVAVKTLGNNTVSIYVKIAKYAGFCMAVYTSNAYDHFTAGIHFRLERKSIMLSTEEAAELDAEEETAYFQHWLGRENVGLGYNNNNDLLLRGQLVNNSTLGTSSQSLRVMVNGQAYGIELKPLDS